MRQRRVHRRGDRGSTHVLEAVIIATIMLSAIAFVATFENPTTSSSPTRNLLRQQADDALAILMSQPVAGSTMGDDMLSLLLAQCMQGDCANITNKIGHLLPAGASYALYVSNGYDTFPVYVTRSPPGEAITAKRLIEPKWSYTFTSPATTNVNNASDPMLVYSLPVLNSNVISPGGSPLKITVWGSKRNDHSDYILQSYSTTEAHDAITPAAAVSMNFLVNRTDAGSLSPAKPGAYWNADSFTVRNGWPTNASLPVKIQIDQSAAGRTIPAGTVLTLHVPRGWNASGFNDANWQIQQDATDWNNTKGFSDVVATLLAPITTTQTFTFYATYHGDLLNYYTFNAVLSNGADAEANLVVKADGWPAYTQTFAAPGVVASVPRPMGVTDETTWSLAVTIPYDSVSAGVTTKDGLQSYSVPDPTSGVRGRPGVHMGATTPEAQAIDVTRINITELNGAHIFDTITPGDITEGAWTTDGVNLTWTGNHDTHLGPLSLTFKVRGAGVAGDQAARKAIVPPVTFDTYNGRLVDQISPGFFRTVVLPDNSTGPLYQTTPGMVPYHGYNAYSPSSATTFDHRYTSSPTYRGVPLDGSSSYTLNPTLPFQDSLYGSYANVNQRTVPLGGQVIVTADVQSVLYALSAAGVPAGVKLTFYPPWSGDSHVPIWTQPNLDADLGTSGVAGIVMRDVNGDGIADPIVGTTNGRVFALDSQTGSRIQGTAWSAPLKGGATSTAAAVDVMTLARAHGHDYIVVGLDSSADLYVLDTGLNAFASFPTASSVVALDATTDFSSPPDGEPDVVAYMADGTVYVLSIPTTTGPLVPITTPGALANTFYKEVSGGALVTEQVTGLHGYPGVALGYVANGGATVTFTTDPSNPFGVPMPQEGITTPGTGLQMIDTTGTPAWSIQGIHPNVMRPYDHNHDGAGDLLVGAANGYVYAFNGSKAGLPAMAINWLPASAALDADMHDVSHGAFVTDDGGIYYTLDGWDSFQCVNCDPILTYSSVDARLNGISLNGLGSIWAVGSSGTAYKSSNTIVAGHPRMDPVTITATDSGSPLDLITNLRDYNDVQFHWETNNGWIVGSPVLGSCTLAGALSATCTEALILKTTDGSTWSSLTFENGKVDTKIAQALTRINFTDTQHGWIVGKAGTLLRSVDSGATWQKITTGTTNDLYDISCAPTDATTCMLVGTNGYLQKLTNALSTPPTWTNLSLNLAANATSLSNAPIPRPLYSVSMANTTSAYVGSTASIWRTMNGGLNWTNVPSNGASTDNVSRIIAFDDGAGFGFGGNATMETTFHFATFRGASSARTTDITLGSLALNAVIDSVEVTALVGTSAMGQTDANVSVSTDGGTTWIRATDLGSAAVSSTDNGVSIIRPIHTFRAVAGTGRTVLVKVDFWNAPDLSYQTARVSDMAADVRWHVGSGAVQPTHYAIPLTNLAYKDTDITHTNATWDPIMGELRNPIAPQFWASNVSGEVKDIQAPYDIAGDTHPDVWVGTGSVLASNSADYKAFIGSNGDPETVVRADNRIYLLDGKNGTIIANSSMLPGPVHALRLQDVNADNVPDYVFAAYDANATGIAGVRAYYARNLTQVPTTPTTQWDLIATSGVTALEVGTVSNGAAMFYGTNVTSNGARTSSGIIYAYNDTKALNHWAVPTDTHGAYVVKKTIPTNWLFGPYVIEISVDWSDQVVTTDGATHTVAQSARYYDYFMVTPPAALTALPSPLYDVHLVAWMDDWR